MKLGVSEDLGSISVIQLHKVKKEKHKQKLLSHCQLIFAKSHQRLKGKKLNCDT